MSTDGSIVMIMTVMVWYLQKFCSPYFIDFSDFVSYAYMHYMLMKIQEFDDPRDAEDAVYDLNGRELCGERVIVELSRRAPRQGGGGGGGGGYRGGGGGGGYDRNGRRYYYRQ